ncbi:hemin receptor [Corynebacterium silvaticum]|uniref:Hemin receptor n=1 Tax=Corynebacterium silvaticum TaxID=2320431 RepID=A0A7Y4P852_9CORY|nr:hemin receptor [Corynebacterium silvaticum]ARU45597.1 hemin receptor [Corynebacterium silvaticum]MBH5300181.1 hemin receptor [Corynebacterium silvaticum]NOM65597.1 hemin receptor [Corynebacterium silvaticum]NON70453.1 hemin receptor [Corynebacterium silvaticum]TFA91995.1 hemin receptor [Corynebacterium silvaticum]
MNTSTTSAFKNLYPDVDPTQGLPLNWSERLSITFSCATLAFGAVFGDLIIVGAGLAFILFSTTAPAQKTARRIRTEAKNRFPAQPWAENTKGSGRQHIIFILLFWVAIAAVCIGLFLATPQISRFLAATIAAAVAGILTWFMPGMSPVWRRGAGGRR